MIIDCISDLHGHYPKLEGGDLLIVAGDLTARNTEKQHAEFAYWLEAQKYSKKIVVCGNHDTLIQDVGECAINMFPDATYLCDSGTEFVVYPQLSSMKEGKVYERQKVKIWGSPWTLSFEGMNPHCKAFTCDTEEELAEKWALIPDGIDILITHGAPYGILDEVRKYGPFSHEREQCAGSQSLLIRVLEARPRLHVFGHIHEAYGHYKHESRYMDISSGEPKRKDFATEFYNASYVNEHYKPVNKPIRVIL